MPTRPRPLLRLLAALVLALPACSAPVDTDHSSASAGAGGATSSNATTDATTSATSSGTTSASGTTGAGGATPLLACGPELGASVGLKGACGFGQAYGSGGIPLLGSLVVDACGNTLLSGRFGKTLAFGDQTLDSGDPMPSGDISAVFLVKLDPTGSALWSHVFAPLDGSHEAFDAPLLALDPTGAAVMGASTKAVDLGLGPIGPAAGAGVVIAKFDPQGKVLWNVVGEPTSFLLSVAVDAVGDVAFLTEQWLASGLTLDLVKLDPKGALLWTKSFAMSSGLMSEGRNGGPFVAFDSAGAVVLVTAASAFVGMTGSVDFGGGPLAITDGTRNLFVAKFDAAGSHVWSRLLVKSPTKADDALLMATIAAGQGGDLFVTSEHHGAVDAGNGVLTPDGTGLAALVVKLDGQGHTVWSRLLGEDVTATGLGVTPKGDVVVGGLIDMQLQLDGPALQPGAYAARLGGASGKTLAQAGVAGTIGFYQLGVQADAVVVGGALFGPTDFCSETLTGSSADDLVVAQLKL